MAPAAPLRHLVPIVVVVVILSPHLLLLLFGANVPPSSSASSSSSSSSSPDFASRLQMSIDDATNDVSSDDRYEHVCSNVEVRSQMSGFKKLSNCTVVEGYVKILLLEYTDESHFAHLSFPELREITGYLLLYRVYGLKSVGSLFPNLAVIRGHELFFNYGLVIFELVNLEDIGLHSLTRIVRGGVRFEKNPRLCYVDTIDWTKVTSVQSEVNFIMQNKEPGECVNLCPKSPDGLTKCPTVDVTLVSGEKALEELCWNSDFCQKICPATCTGNACFLANGSGRMETSCCHPQCVGGCSGPLDTDCFVCANIFHKGKCLPKCPSNTYMYRSRRCLLESECRALTVRSSMHGSTQKSRFWKIHDGRCIEDCPTGFMPKSDDQHQCERCPGHCPKVCSSVIVDNLQSAQKLSGCTIIEGILDIQLRGGVGSLGVELEESLGMIEEVTHYVKIARSYALVSLRFLRNLRVIHGKRLLVDRYALFVLDNQNLQDLWNLDIHPNMTLKNGTLFFHYNRKLCLNKIMKFIDFVGKGDQIDDKDVSPSSNGDQVACDLEMLDLEIVMVATTHAIIKWKNFRVNDPREMLGWVINYRKATEENLTIYSARDACGTDVWKTNDMKSESENSAEHLANIIFGLEPFTKYAVYVQTYSISTARVGAMSKIVYFTTQADMPSPVRDITVEAKYPGELHVSWKAPARPNGNVTHYYVYWQSQQLMPEKFHQRDYCKDKLRLPSKTDKVTIIPTSEKNVTSNECCECPKTTAQILVEDSERRYQIEFENFLHDSIYKKTSVLSSNIPSSLRKRREANSDAAHPSSREKRYPPSQYDIESFAQKNPEFKSLLRNNSEHPNTTLSSVTVGQEPTPPPETHEAAIVYGTTDIILTNLKHFQEYSIEVIACHDYIEGMDDKLCSNRAIISGRTLPDASADVVDPRNISITNVTSEGELSSVLVSWKEPSSPNGIVVSFEIELKMNDVPNYKPDILCISHQQYTQENGRYLVQNLRSGTWSFRLRATSLVGSGNWTDYQEFYVARVEMITHSVNTTLIVSVVIMLVVVVAVSTVTVFFIRRKNNAHLTEANLQTVTYNPNYSLEKAEYVPDEWEVDREKIDILRELGQGSFGMVYEGLARDLSDTEPLLRVAVKTVNVDAPINDRYSFLNEASIMKAFDSYHVVKLLGVVSKGQPVLVIMELMSNGDLKTYLRLRRPDEPDKDVNLEPPTLTELLKWAGEIADGMAYLSSIKFVHRDLAARNCMVSTYATVKIGDFGMTRDVYATDYYRKGSKGLLPVRWMAPESLRDGVFTSRSDVWSYGIVLWEMATLAAQPYQGLSNEQVLHYVIDGSVMERPEGCPDRLYRMMEWCWKLSPKERPSFYDILEDLADDMPESFRENSFYFKQQEAADDDDEDFESAGSIIDDKDIGFDDDNDDYDLIHSKTPLHPTKSNPWDASPADVLCVESDSLQPNMVISSRGFPLPIQLQNSTDFLPSPLSPRRVSGFGSVLNGDKTSQSDDTDLKETSSDAQSVRLSPKLPPYRRDCLVNATNDRLSSPGRSRRAIGDSQPDVIRAGYMEQSPPVGGSSNKTGSNSIHGPHKNGLVNGVVLPSYPYRTTTPC